LTEEISISRSDAGGISTAAFNSSLSIKKYKTYAFYQAKNYPNLGKLFF